MNSIKKLSQLTKKELQTRLRILQLELSKRFDIVFRREVKMIEDRIMEINERDLIQNNFNAFNPDGN